MTCVTSLVRAWEMARHLSPCELLRHGSLMRSDILDLCKTVQDGVVACRYPRRLPLLHQKRQRRRLLAQKSVFVCIFPQRFPEIAEEIVRASSAPLHRPPPLPNPCLSPMRTGLSDELIPPWHMRTLYNATPEKSGGGKRFITVTNGAHNDTWEKGGQEYLRALDTFIQEVHGVVCCFAVCGWLDNRIGAYYYY